MILTLFIVADASAIEFQGQSIGKACEFASWPPFGRVTDIIPAALQRQQHPFQSPLSDPSPASASATTSGSVFFRGEAGSGSRPCCHQQGEDHGSGEKGCATKPEEVSEVGLLRQVCAGMALTQKCLIHSSMRQRPH